MLKYYHKEKEAESSNNQENLFVHRLHGNTDLSQADDMRLSMSTTFWRSPYSGNSGMSNATRGVCIKPVISVTSPRQKQTTSINDTSKLTTKSILKHRTSSEYNIDSSKNELKSETSPEQLQPNLITTGTGKGRPHGSPVRQKRAGKRVQFHGITRQNNIDTSQKFTFPSTSAYFTGRRLFLDRSTSARILGAPKTSSPRCQVNKYSNNSNATLNGGEANIKSQINAFIRKLRLTENEKNVTNEENKTTIPESQRKTAATLRKSRSFSGTSGQPDWAEFDIERVHLNTAVSSDIDSTQNLKETDPYIVYDAKSRSVSSGSISIESFSSASDDDRVVERTPGGAKIFRPRPNASLYTKYKHITTNENVNKYGPRPYSSVESDRKSVNFCDSRKTSQILGWLEEVRCAQSTQNPPDSPNTKT